MTRWRSDPSQELRERVLRGKYRIPFYISTECEDLLKKFLVLQPHKRTDLTSVMTDVRLPRRVANVLMVPQKWLNMNFEDEPLVPFTEPETNVQAHLVSAAKLTCISQFRDEKRFKIMEGYGYTREQVIDSLDVIWVTAVPIHSLAV